MPLLPLTRPKTAGVIDTMTRAVSHPLGQAALAASPIIAAAVPMAQEALRKNKEETPKLSGLIDGAAKAFAHPLGQAAMAFGPTLLSGLGSRKPAAPPRPMAPPAGPEGTNAQPSGAFQPPGMTRQASVLNTPEGSVNASQPVMQPAQAVGPGGVGTATPKSKIQVPKAAPSALKAFKVSGLGGVERALNIGSQAAVIGASALPFYQIWKDQQASRARSPRQQLHDADALQKVSELLPLRPKPSLKERVKDFAGGAYDALDNEAGKLLQPTDHLDPIRNRPTTHII